MTMTEGVPLVLAQALGVGDSAWQAALGIIARLQQSGYQAYAVGGAVRDAVLGLAVHDVDVCTSASPEQVEALFPQAVGIGRAFGIMLIPDHRAAVEVATFRSDGVYVDGRRPQGICSASEAEDAQRRDFTINALYYDPARQEIRDHVGGLQDCAQRCLRAIGCAADRLREDRLRVLRGFRFAAHLQLSIEEETAAALAQTSLQGLSAERVLQEWCRGLAHVQGYQWWGNVCSAGLQPLLSADASPTVGQLAWRMVADDARRATAFLHRHLAHAYLQSWLERWPWSRGARREIAAIHAGWAAIRSGIRGAPRARLLRSPEAEAIVACAQAAELEGEWPSGMAAQLSLDLVEEMARSWPVISSQDCLEAGIAPGPQLGQILRATEDALLDGRLADRRAALAALRQAAACGA